MSQLYLLMSNRFVQKSLCILVCLFIQLSSQFGYSQNAQDAATELKLNKPVEREISGNQKHLYQIALAQGQCASAIVEQMGIDIVIRLLGANDKPLASFDSEIRAKGTEKIEFVAPESGVYKLEVGARYTRFPAGRYEIRVAELRAATDKDRSLQEAHKLFEESAKLRRNGKYDEALAKLESALQIREKTLGADHIEVAKNLDTIAFFYFNMSDYAKAESLLKRALAIKEKALEPDHPEIAQALNSLGLVLADKGEYAKAIPLYEKALTIREKSLNANHPGVANTLNNLGNIYNDQANYVKAEPLLERALEIYESAFGPDNSNVADALNNLAIINMQRGNYYKAETLYKRALEIREKVFGPDHPEVASSLNNLATVYERIGEYEKSQPLYQRSLEIREKTFGPDHPETAQTLYNLGNTYSLTKKFDKAEPIYLRALKILEDRLGPDHVNLTFPLKSLAVLYRNKDEYDKSETFYKRVLAIRQKVLGPDHPDVAEDLISFSTLYAAKGFAKEAIATEARASLIAERATVLNLAAGSESQKLAYLAASSEVANYSIALHTQLFPENTNALDIAATTILQRKGRVQDAMVDSLSGLRKRLNTQDQTLLDKLNEANTQLAKLVLNGPKNMPLEEHQNRIKSLEEQREKLEAEISRLSAEYSIQTQPITLAAVLANIPDDAALVEFAVYRPFASKATTERGELSEPHYVAYVIRKRVEGVGWKELGPTKTIDAAIGDLRKALRDPKRKDVQTLARFVDEKVMQPVRALLGDAKHILVSPDGELNLIPFEALVDERGQYLIENYSFNYLTSGRDLLRMQVARQSLSDTLVIADPTFGEPLTEQIARGNNQKIKRALPNKKRRSVTTGRDLSGVYFAPLVGAAQEARAIKTFFPEANLLMRAQATEISLKKTMGPRILHIATHGFFLEDKALETRQANNTNIGNPLLRSGLAFANANLRDESADDGILTALEASGLNLWGTKLVVLSACDTGVGEVKTGEGVYGLRRAFVLAGTETLVMSLWPVSDYATRELMTNYYKGLKQGLGRGQALRQVQLEMLKRTGRQHPFYWSGFIQSGEWANMEGKR